MRPHLGILGGGRTLLQVRGSTFGVFYTRLVLLEPFSVRARYVRCAEYQDKSCKRHETRGTQS